MIIDVVLPCLNEAPALPWLLDRLPEGFRAVVADNGSTDGSQAIATGYGAQVVDVPLRGYGAAVDGGLRAATSELVCVMDADGTLDPRELPELIAPLRIGSADMVLGRRVPSTAGAWPIPARVANAALSATLRLRTELQVHDLSPLRAARRDALLELQLRDRRFGYPLETVLAAARAGWRVVEVPVAYSPRIGKSKVTGTVGGYLRTVKDMAGVLTQ